MANLAGAWASGDGCGKLVVELAYLVCEAKSFEMNYPKAEYGAYYPN